MAYTLAGMLKEIQPSSDIVAIDKHRKNFPTFLLLKNYMVDYLLDDLEVDYAFECTGGEGSYYAIDDIIKYIATQRAVTLIGVAENRILICTRNI